MQKNMDIEVDEVEERKKILRDLFRKYGEHTRLLLTLAELTGRTLPEVCDIWKANGSLIHTALGRSAGD